MPCLIPGPQHQGTKVNTLAFTTQIHGPDESGTPFLVPVALVDQKPLADFKTYAINLNELSRSRTEQGEHFILTCWCGVPECVRIDAGFTVENHGNTIQWKTKYPDTPRTITFSAQAYHQAVTELITRLPVEFGNARALHPKLELVPSGCERFVQAGA